MKMFIEPSDIYLHRPSVDFRKSINGLANIVIAEMNLNVMSGAVFIFCNKNKDKLKILYWDKTGFALRPPWTAEGRTTQEQLSSTKNLRKISSNGRILSMKIS